MLSLCKKLLVSLFVFSGPAIAHQWTPTYPKWESSYVDGVVSVKMELFNSRKDVEWYGVQVLDADMEPVPFVTSEKVMNVPHLKKKRVEVYVRKQDIERAVYICSVSKLLKEQRSRAAVASRICSKAK
jgi:hypothetical protein